METLQGVTVGFIGLDPMGKQMALRIQEAGAKMYAYHASPSIRYEIARAKINLCGSAAEISRKVAGGIILLKVDSTRDLDGILMGEDSLLSHITKGTIIIDVGTTPVTTTQQFAKIAEARGAHWIDAPAIGDEVAASRGELEINVGASDEEYKQVLKVLDCLGNKITHAGGLGSGQSQTLALQH
jgi:3-hydroxyisobutyrate dehydrogenase-like beta-hydroxyacid dehydrogenase